MATAQPMRSLIICLIGFLTALQLLRWFRLLCNNDGVLGLSSSTTNKSSELPPCIAFLRNGNADLSRSHLQSFCNDAEFPQKLTFGRFTNESAYPFLGSDIYANLVDNQRTFFIREYEKDFPGYRVLKKWIASRPHPITLVFNNNVDRSWPPQMDRSWLSNWKRNDWKQMLSEPNLHAVFVGGLRDFENEFKSKVKPMPLGLKWQHYTTELFGEPKGPLKAVYSSLSKSPQESKRLFELPNRTNTVWVRPMTDSNRHTSNYDKTNPALTTLRSKVAQVLFASAPSSTVDGSASMLNQRDYLQELKRHRFLANPAGNGLDTHSTWEALLAGCIPINPHSPLDPLYDGLPVWLIHSWDEVTDDAVQKKALEMMNPMASTSTYDWSLVFAEGWKRKIHEGLSV